ncbi:TauD/TfdA family dioxygenase [uncultured Dokdonia sp.]|uniref:TauD/TfdA family dioxygenase n=1 Tax=uncultured Dokdonia sp. TaxID=575653 RepID=UPI00260E12C4|nr:TauD/TfdA family dioxygenase [uncultured Dokdonia sp.]
MKTQEKILRVCLSEEEKSAIENLALVISDNPKMLDEFSFLSNSHLYAQELPRRVRELFYQFKNQESHLAILIENAPLFKKDFPKTPTKYREKHDYKLDRSDIIHGLFSSLLGEPFSFSTQRHGHAYNRIIPLPKFESISNSSSGSLYNFGFHSEDAFHIGMPDYLGLMCLRNTENAPTVIASIKDVFIPREIKKILFEPQFYIESNPIHKNVIKEINSTKKSILFGHFDNPYLRINMNTLDLNMYEGKVKEALSFIYEAINKNKIEITLKSGNCLYVDNFNAVHRRDSFIPNYGDEARWLTRLVVTNDLRKTRHLRDKADSRIIN